MKTELTALGITNPSTIHHNLTAGRLVEEAVRRGEAHLSRHGALIANTGKYTGRSPNDKFTVKDGETADTVWWGKVNRPIEADVFDNLRTAAQHMPMAALALSTAIVAATS